MSELGCNLRLCVKSRLKLGSTGGICRLWLRIGLKFGLGEGKRLIDHVLTFRDWVRETRKGDWPKWGKNLFYSSKSTEDVCR